ncbi:MAG TPA: 30S ribosomal protein S7 [Anaerolineaceae bacterium]|jgi:small subunit ribosomal protein S7|nr:30S ribosomal protein S7 [Anaerolineaceae bacterium]HNZ14979.1 30S ribosomal protein S7 [Anaerolineaceae bacterium]HOH92051.1 30S ribosomal protein S7 [Anaerolineaceae bacterium]HPX65090.1 30S ribosomal protein S7 [Anaerolineaceae bacterium]HQL91898.1 30S ribosomal protein S7 [Anaerolineaceae bacterium]
MSRRIKPEKREVKPDDRYNNIHLQMIINRIMLNGKKSLATTMVYDALDIISEKTGKEGIEVFETALKNVSPLMEVRPRRIGGSTYQVPMEVAPDRRVVLAMRWIITASRARSGKSYPEKLAAELMDAAENQGASVRRKEETHKMAEANRAFSHFRM